MVDRMVTGMYDGMRLAVPDWPDAEPIGNGWWRTEWIVEFDSSTSPSWPRLPVPGPRMSELSFVVGLAPVGNGRLRLEALSRYRRLDPLEIAYVSLVLQCLEASLGPLLVDGATHHPMLRMALPDRA